MGDHEYVVPPLALRVVEVPEHIVTSTLVVMVGIGFTLTVNMAVLLQPPVVPVTV